jgi:pimeloyl-ACP methyl ester carboxylesterase
LADYRLWGGLSDVLSKRFRVISYSRRGYYPNERPAGASTVPLHSSDLASLISQVTEGPVHLVGESYGAYVAMHFAIHNPAQVKTLVIDEPPILPLLFASDDGRAEARRFEGEVLRPFVEHCSLGRGEAAAKVLIGYLEGSQLVYDSLPMEARDMILANTAGTCSDLMGGFEGITRVELSHMKPPVLLLKSEFGPDLLTRIVDIMHEVIPIRSIENVKGTSHGTIIESPNYFSVVSEFLSRNE